MIALDDAGEPDFALLQDRIKAREPAAEPTAFVYEVFDLLHLDGRSLLDEPLETRRRLLAGVLRPDPRVRLSEHIETDGLAFFEAARARGLEGIMAKERSSPYVPGGRTMAWQKIKIRPEQELVVGGWTPGTGKAFGLGALLVGVYEDGALRYAGKVGARSWARAGASSRPRSQPLATDDPPFDPPPPKPVARRRRGLARSSSSGPSSPAGRATARSARRPTRASTSARTRGRSSARSPAPDPAPGRADQQSKANQHSSLRSRWSSSTSSRIALGQPGALPPALPAPGVVARAVGRGGAGGPDGVGRGTELVGRDVGDHPGLAGGECGVSRGSGEVPGGGVGMAAGRACLGHRHLASCPGTRQLDRPSRTVILGPRLLEVVQHVLRAVGRPQREQVMIVVREAAAATHGDEPRVPDLGQDHRPHRTARRRCTTGP